MSARDDLAAAFRRTEALGNEPIDRKGWTKNQWADDAERIMEHIDGSITALVNGHALGLIARVRELTPRTITTVEELDKLPLRTLVAAITHNRNVPIIIVFQRGSNWDGGDGWTTPEAVGQIPSEKVFEFIALNGLPTVFTVLHDPEATA